MSKENVERFVRRVAQDAQLANELKAVPAGAGAESAFVALGAREGFSFTVEELRAAAKVAATTTAVRASEEGAASQTDDDGLWVLDYFYGPEGKWTK